MSEPDANVGTCDLCDQVLIRTDEDCWHPYNVAKACPAEPKGSEAYAAWCSAGFRTGRPGREHWRPALPAGAVLGSSDEDTHRNPDGVAPGV